MTPQAQSEIAVSTEANAGSQLAALLQDAGFATLDSIGWIRVTGEDRVRWLNGMVTNSIQELKTGEGNYNFLLSVQGRIQGDGYIFAEPDALVIETAAEQVPGLMALLDRFIIMDDVELLNVSEGCVGLMVAGPRAAAMLQTMGIGVEDFGELERRTVASGVGEVTVIGAYSPLVPKFEIWIDHIDHVDALRQGLLNSGAAACQAQSVEWLRVMEGTPLYGVDIRDRELPQETGQSRALHFAKGCYLGQEIVERIRSRGNVHRGFSGFRLEGTLPAAGAKLNADGKEIGELTTVATIPVPGQSDRMQLGLGYVRREVLERGTQIVFTGGVAMDATLPFSTAETVQGRSASESSERV
jgi:folate-binding protein YgfZ